MPSLTDGEIRRALKQVEQTGKQLSLVDGEGHGTGRLVQYGSRQMRWMQSGQVGSYVLLMVLGMLVFFVIQFFIKK